MARPYTSTKLIESVKSRAMIPTSQNTFTNQDFLNFANEELSIGLLPTILRVHEDYLLYTKEIPLVPGQREYPIPSRASGNKLRDVGLKDTNGNVYEMTRIGIGDLSQYENRISSRLDSFYIKNNKVVLAPGDNGPQSGFLLMSFYLRPNDIVMEDRAATITNINRNTGVISVNNIPDHFSTAIKYDFIGHKSPFVSLDIGLTALSINSVTNSAEFAIDKIPADLEVGDYLMAEEETIVPQIPVDLHVVLAHRVATRCLEALGDTEGLSNANRKLMEMEDKTTNLIDNRVEDAPKKIVNRHSSLRAGVFRGRRGGR